jgi:hypothetical protein
MVPRPVLRARHAIAALLVAGVLAASSHGTLALLSGRATNAAAGFSTTALYAPGSLTATASGHDVLLSWPSGTNGSSYTVTGKANGTSSTCTSTSLSAVGVSATTTLTDTGRYTPQGTWFCHQVATTYSGWTSVQANPLVATQLGVVASSVQLVNGSTAGSLVTGDFIVVTFNQAITVASGPSGTNSVCTTSASGTAGVIVIGATASTGSCVAGEATNLGTLTGIASNRNNRYAATYTWSNSNKTLTVTVGSRTVGSGNPTITGTATLAPTTTATKLLSATGSFHACDTNTGGGSCLPTATGSL